MLPRDVWHPMVPSVKKDELARIHILFVPDVYSPPFYLHRNNQHARTRAENKALRAREKDAAELRSLLEQKRGVSAQLARGAEAARARAERAEGAAEALRAEGESLR